VCAKLPSGYQRDLQLIKAPLFRGIDRTIQSAQIMAAALDGVKFLPANIELSPDLRAAEEANALVVSEGIPFREAYRRVGARYRKS
jgi:argininosuccinate lyase